MGFIMSSCALALLSVSTWLFNQTCKASLLKRLFRMKFTEPSLASGDPGMWRHLLPRCPHSHLSEHPSVCTCVRVIECDLHPRHLPKPLCAWRDIDLTRLHIISSSGSKCQWPVSRTLALFKAVWSEGQQTDTDCDVNAFRLLVQ